MGRADLIRALALLVIAACAHADRGADVGAVIARAQTRLAQAPALLRFMDPTGGEVDLDEAARRITAVIADCRADQKKLAQLADDLAEEHPDPARAPTAAVVVRARAAAFRYREWALLQLLGATRRVLADFQARGTPSTAELLLAAGQLDLIVYPREGAVLLRRWLEIAPEALRRAEATADRADLLADVRMMAFAWAPAQWSARDAKDVRAHVDAFRAAAAGLAPPLPAVVARWWDWGAANGGAPMPVSIVREQAKDLRALGLEALAADVEAGAAP